MSRISSIKRDSRWISLGVLCVGMLMVVLDNTVVNVALPSIQNDLGFSQSSLAWVVNAYMIAFGGLLLLAGRLGDLIGSQRIFIAGLVAFTLASLVCGIAWTREILVVARFVQGIGGAMASSLILAMIVTMFEEPQERAKAMGVFSFTASAGGSIGLLVGGVLTQLVSWHWIFLVNVPIGIAAVILAVRFLKSGTGIGLRNGADALGALLVTASLMLAVYTVVEIPTRGATTPRTLAFGTIAVILFAAFIARQATATKPLLPLRLFRSRNVCGSNILQLLLFAGMFGFFFLDSLYLRRILGYDAVATGLAFLPVTIAIGTLSLGWSARLSTRFGPRSVVIAGTGLAAVGLAIFAIAPLQSSYVTTILPAMVFLGVGMGVSFPSLMMFAMSSATPSDAGLTSGLVNTTSQVGGAFGLAILASLSASRSHDLVASGSGNVAALAAGYHLAFGVAACCLVVSGIIAATVLQSEEVEADVETTSRSKVA
ncbi:MAG: DHA2 family efflux MFS transporter permease subunit [Vulcanimicrobiaceae bacterium]